MNLSEFSTAQLVAELKRREGVDAVMVEAYQPFAITVGGESTTDTGPVTILRVWD